MARPKPEKVKDCQKLAKKYGLDKVLMVGINEQDGQFSISSYGKNRRECDKAKEIGKSIHRAVIEFYTNE